MTDKYGWNNETSYEEVVNIVDAGLEQLQFAPFIEKDSLFRYMSYEISPDGRTTGQVDVNRIISSPYCTSWADIEREYEYIVKFTRFLIDNPDFVKLHPVNVQEFDGFYSIGYDGRTRVAIAKILGWRSIPATINSIKPKSIYGTTVENAYELDRRRKLGLWEGDIYYQKVPSTDFKHNREAYVYGEIKSYRGLWVFAEDMESAKFNYEFAQERSSNINLS